MTTKYNVMVLPFTFWGRTVRNPLTIMRDRMLEDMPIIRHGRVIGSVITNSVKVGSDGFYADIYVVDNYADVKLEFKDLSWNGFPCDGNKWVVESIAQVVMAPKT